MMSHLQTLVGTVIHGAMWSARQKCWTTVRTLGALQLFIALSLSGRLEADTPVTLQRIISM